MGSCQMMLCLTLMKGINHEEHDKEYQGNTRTDESLADEVCLLAGNLCLLLLGVIDGSQLSSIIPLVPEDGRVKGFTNL